MCAALKNRIVCRGVFRILHSFQELNYLGNSEKNYKQSNFETLIDAIYVLYHGLLCIVFTLEVGSESVLKVFVGRS